jgi:hypothetical protein
VDAMVDLMILGKGESPSMGSGSSTGVVIFAQGTIDVNTLQLGVQTPGSTGGTTAGTIGTNYAGEMDVNGAAILVVNSNMFLTSLAGGAGNYSLNATLNINGGTVLANTIVNGGGQAVVNINGGTLDLANTMGTSARAISVLNLSNAVLHFQLDGSAMVTNIVTTNLIVSGLTSIVVESLANAPGTNRFPLIKYMALSGSVAGNFSVAAVPDGFAGSLSNNAANQTIDLIIGPAPIPRPVITAVSFSAVNSTLTLIGNNGIPGNSYSVLASTNAALPLGAWVSQGDDVFDGNGNFNFIISVDPNLPRQFFVLQVQP